jgi:hypothetical protein
MAETRDDDAITAMINAAAGNAESFLIQRDRFDRDTVPTFVKSGVEAPGLTERQDTTASASISTSISGEINALTWTIDVAGRTSRKNSPCALPTFSQSAMLIT